MNDRNAGADDSNVGFYDAPLYDDHAIIYNKFSAAALRKTESAGVGRNVHVRSGSMAAFSNDARKQLTTRTLAKVRKKTLFFINLIYSQGSQSEQEN